MKPRSAPATDAAVATKAVLRAAERLGLSNKTLAKVIGVSEATVSRMSAGSYQLARGDKPFELGLLFVRLFRSLDALWGHEETARAWLASENLALAARPQDLLPSVEGMVRVVAYLDAARGRV